MFSLSNVYASRQNFNPPERTSTSNVISFLFKIWRGSLWSSCTRDGILGKFNKFYQKIKFIRLKMIYACGQVVRKKYGEKKSMKKGLDPLVRGTIRESGSAPKCNRSLTLLIINFVLLLFPYRSRRGRSAWMPARSCHRSRTCWARARSLAWSSTRRSGYSAAENNKKSGYSAAED